MKTSEILRELPKCDKETQTGRRALDKKPDTQLAKQAAKRFPTLLRVRK